MTTTEVKPQTGTVTFRGVRRALRLVRVKQYPIHDAGGNRIGLTPGIAYEFETGDPPGDLTFAPGDSVYADGPAGEDGKPTEQDAISWMRAHGSYNQSGDGFFEVGAEPDRIPESGPLLAEIAQAAATGDRETLEAIEAAEMHPEGHGRMDVIQTVRAALAALETPPAA